MRKIIALILGFLFAYYMLHHWDFVVLHFGVKVAKFIMLYVLALGIIHIGGISLKILSVLFVLLEPLADKYCYWYGNTRFYNWLHRNDKNKY